jgi:cysteine-rich repeat protein
VPGSAICGDGVLDTFCERCDAGLANSDTTPDACRTDCELPRCGDGTIDGGEACDDGNTSDCDGCSAECVVEAGLGCGDGVPFPTCGEACDDANAIDGDGCASCVLERGSGGGSATTDCFTAWSIDNPANEPRYAKTGAISDVQVCTDNDARCDFDGGVAGGCTFHVRVCANNTHLAACTPGTRLASWELRTPSAAQAETRPTAAAVRQALLSVVPGSIVGPSQHDVCSPLAAVPVTLRGAAGAWGKGRVTLKTLAELYDGRKDNDKLRLECRPTP